MSDPIDTEHCAKCSYSACNGTLGVHCEFILITGHMRGCEPGENCDKFTTEPVRRDPDQLANNFMQKKGNTSETKNESGKSVMLGSVWEGGGEDEQSRSMAHRRFN